MNKKIRDRIVKKISDLLYFDVSDSDKCAENIISIIEIIEKEFGVERNRQDLCEFYPTGDEPVCDCGSDVSGPVICTKLYSLTCQWANEMRNRQDG